MAQGNSRIKCQNRINELSVFYQPDSLRHDFERSPDVSFGGVDVPDRYSEGIAATHPGVRQVNLASGVYALKYPLIMVVQCFSGHAGGTMPEHHGRELRVGHSLELGIGVYPRAELPGQPDVLTDQRPQSLHAEAPDDKPELESPEAAAQ